MTQDSNTQTHLDLSKTSPSKKAEDSKITELTGEGDNATSSVRERSRDSDFTPPGLRGKI